MGNSVDSYGADAIAQWRKFVLDRVLAFSLLMVTAAVLLALREDYRFGHPVLAYALIPSWLLVAVATLWPRAPTRFRQVALIVGIATAAVGSASLAGFLMPNPFSAHLMLVLVVTLFLGQRAAWWVWLGGLLLWILIAIAFVGGRELVYPPSFDLSTPSNWVRVLVIYGSISAATLSAVAYLTNRMENAVKQSAALVDALTEESGRRIAALEEQRELEEQLRQSQKLEALGTLAGGVAHDFNTLLLVIINQADMAMAKPESAPVREALAEIVEAGDRAAVLTRQLLTFGRRQVSEREALNLAPRIEESLRLITRLLPDSIEVDTTLEADLPLVRAAGIEIDQVVMNLCVNARDAMPEGGHISLTARLKRRTAPDAPAEESFVCVAVRDDGCGMDQQTQERIFEPFFTTKAVGLGTGLGLSTVHGLVRQAGGFIEVESAPGEGTLIELYFPVYDGPAVVGGSVVANSSERGSETILLADDDAKVRAILTQQLEAHGYRVLSCVDGEQALRTFEDNADGVDLVICDAIMPKMGGWALHDAVVATHPDVPFLICSGYAAETLSADFFDAPARAFLAKPFNNADLQRKVRGLLKASSKRTPSEPAVGGLMDPDPVG